MKILFVADGRSPIALNWIKYWTKREHEVFLVSTYPATPDLILSRVDFISVAFSQAKSIPSTGSRQKKSPLWGTATLKLRMGIRHWLGPLTIPTAAMQLNELVSEIQPDIVHAMRIPYEGMLAGMAKKLNKDFPPLLISVWGNDFTLHAPSTPLMEDYTRRALHAADALHADCHRDIRLAKEWGFNPTHPSIVLPGAGGIDQSVFYPPEKKNEPLVINPRGFRGYVRNDIFFKAIPLVLKERPDVKFICPTMAGESQAEAWIQEFGVEASVELTPPLKREQLANTFRRAQVLVSPSTHDGTPNSLIEGMACGCFPIAGDLESIREWITPEVNGFLIDPSDEKELSDAILRALNDKTLRKEAIVENQKIIATRAEYEHSMGQADIFYKAII